MLLYTNIACLVTVCCYWWCQAYETRCTTSIIVARLTQIRSVSPLISHKNIFNEQTKWWPVMITICQPPVLTKCTLLYTVKIAVTARIRCDKDLNDGWQEDTSKWPSHVVSYRIAVGMQDECFCCLWPTAVSHLPNCITYNRTFISLYTLNSLFNWSTTCDNELTTRSTVNQDGVLAAE